MTKPVREVHEDWADCPVVRGVEFVTGVARTLNWADSVTRSGASDLGSRTAGSKDRAPFGGGASRGTDGGLKQPWMRKAVDGRTRSTPPTSGYLTRTPAITNCDWTNPHRSRPRREPPVRAAPQQARRCEAPGPEKSRASRDSDPGPGVPVSARAVRAMPRAVRIPPRRPPQAQAAQVAQEEGAAVDGRRDGLRRGRRRRRRVPRLPALRLEPEHGRCRGRGQRRLQEGPGRQHPDHRHGQALRRGQRRLRRQEQRRARRHHDPLPCLQGPDERDRAVHPARPDHRHPGLPDQDDRGHQGHRRRRRTPVQREPRPGGPRPGLHHAYGQGDHRHHRRPLHDGRLQRGQDDDHGGRRRRGLPRQGHQGQGLQAQPPGGQARPRG